MRDLVVSGPVAPIRKVPETDEKMIVNRGAYDLHRARRLVSVDWRV